MFAALLLASPFAGSRFVPAGRGPLNAPVSEGTAVASNLVLFAILVLAGVLRHS